MTRLKIWRKLRIALYYLGPMGLLVIFSLTNMIMDHFHRHYTKYKLGAWIYRINNHLLYSSFQTSLAFQRVKTYITGDDLRACFKEPTLVISNHVSTMDSLLFGVLGSENYRNIYHLMVNNGQWLVKYHKLRDQFLIEKNEKGTQERLAAELKTKFFPFNEWFILFPEGGLLRAVKEKLDERAKKKNLPVLKNVATPNGHGFATVINTLGETKQDIESEQSSGQKIKWVLDTTLIYNQEGIEMSGLYVSELPPGSVIYVLTKVYAASQIPRGREEMEKWLLTVFEEKDAILDTFRKTGKIPRMKEMQNDPILRPFFNPSPIFCLVYLIYQSCVFYCIISLFLTFLY